MKSSRQWGFSVIRRSRCSESGGLLRMRMGRASRRSGGLARVGHRQSRARVQRDKQRAAKVRQQQRGQSNPKLPRLPVATLSILDGSTVYVANEGANTVSVIATASNMVTAVIPVGIAPLGVAVTPDGITVYVTNSFQDNTVSVIATASNTVTAVIPVGITPFGVAVTPDGSTVYVGNVTANTVSVIDTTSNTVTATIPVGADPWGVAVTPDGSTVYVANEGANTVSVIAMASNTVTATIPGFSEPIAFGVFIGPPPVLATPPSGTACNGCSTAPSRAR